MSAPTRSFLARTALAVASRRSAAAAQRWSVARSASLTPYNAVASSSRLQTYATSTTPTSSISDPAEIEAQKWLEKGTTHLEAGEMKEAKSAYERSIAVKENSSSFFNLGVVHYHEQDLPAAIKAWESSLRLAPDSPDAHTNLASAYVLSKPSRPDLAIDHLKKAAALAPSDPEIHFNLAAVLEACEQLPESLEAYKRAYDGGIQRAAQNIRNITAKIGAAGAAEAAEKQRVAEEKAQGGAEGEGKKE